MNLARKSVLLALSALAFLASGKLFAQPAAKPSTDAAAASADAKAARPNPCAPEFFTSERTVYLNNSFQTSEANEIVTALRNSLNPCDRVFLVASQSAIVIEANPDQVALAEKLIQELDRPKKTYRLTYTVTDNDNGKRVGTQHFAMVVVSGQQTTMKEGSKIPIATGSYFPSATSGESAHPAGAQTQFTYVDVGMDFSATLDEFANGVRLRSSIEQSSSAGQSVIAGVEEPVIRQSSLSGAAFLTPGKPLVLGSIDVPGSTRRLDIEVVMEPIP